MMDKGVLYTETKAYVVGRASVGARITLRNVGNTEAAIDKATIVGFADYSKIAKSIRFYGETNGWGWIVCSDREPTRKDVYIGMEATDGRIVIGGGEAYFPPLVLLGRANIFVNKRIPPGQAISEEVYFTTLPLWLPYLKVVVVRKARLTPGTGAGMAANVLAYLRGQYTREFLEERVGLGFEPNTDPVGLRFRVVVLSGGMPVIDTATEATIIGRPAVPELRVEITPIVKAPAGVGVETG
jgi:hypothetical protein